MKTAWLPFLCSVGLAGLGVIYAATAGEGSLVELILMGAVGGLVGFGIGFAIHKVSSGLEKPEVRVAADGTVSREAPGGGLAAAVVVGLIGAAKAFIIMSSQ